LTYYLGASLSRWAATGNQFCLKNFFLKKNG
jgi:hypothetical protein